MYKGENFITRKVQLIQLDILKHFMDICDHNHLRWYMIGGSLIGVLRHKGFIPWDDDIDVGMPRDDFDKFVALQNSFPDGYALTDRYSDTNWHFNFVQFVDVNSEIVVKMNEQPRRCKVWIDVFPIDGLPSNRIHRWLHMKKILMYRYLIQIANIKTQVDTHKVGRPWYEKLVISFFHYIPLSRLIDTNKMLDKMNYSLKKYNFDEMDWGGNLLGKRREKEIVPRKWWGDPVLLPFENVMVNCPCDSHKIQEQLYGDYMTWPKEEERVTHDIEF